MLLFGILGFFQSVFLPGYLLMQYLPLVHDSGSVVSDRIRSIVYGFGLSLLINYLLVFYLTLVGMYKAWVIYAVILIEIILLVYGMVKRGGGITFDIGSYVSWFKEFLKSRSLLFNLLFLATLGVIALHLFYFLYFLGTVFMHWDPALSWNRFAVEWSQNRLPANTWRYPQLVPGNWSVSYIIMGSVEVQAFAKSIMPLFSVGILLLYLEWALRLQRAVYLLGLVLFGVLLSFLYDPSVIVSGYVDIAVSFFAFLSFHVMLNRSPDGGRTFYIKRILTALVFACAAGITKQAGIFILLFEFIWILASLFRRRSILERKKILQIVVVMLLMVLIITASWYILKEIQIADGTDSSEINIVQRANKVDSYGERFVRGIDNILNHRNRKLKVIPLTIAFLILLGLFHRRSWWVTLWIVLPYTLMWGFLFSYDNRNLALALPFMAYSGAFGVSFLRSRLTHFAKHTNIKFPVLPWLILVSVILLTFNFTLLKKDSIIAHQSQMKMKLGEPGLNEKLYRFHKQEGIKGKIVSSYHYLAILPQLKEYFIRKPGHISLDYLNFLETSEAKEIRYLLLPVVLNQKHKRELYQRFQQKIKSGQFRLIFKHGQYRFIEIKR